jgi:colanic acid/amylovoran biosynthesis glycosyltransferase
MDIQRRPQQEGYDEQMQRLLQTVPLVLARSRSLMSRLEELGCPANKLRLNRTGIPLEQFTFTQRAMPEDGSWRFVQACRLVAKKGIATSLRAFARFHGLFPNARFTLAGEGPMKPQIEALVAELGLSHAVELRGFLSQQDLAELYARSHIFVHPSEMPPDQNQEGVPNSMLEAMATGLPVLATFHGGIPEAVTHERTGLLVAEKDHEALFAAMQQITSSSDRLFLLGRSAAQTVRDEFEQAKQVEKLEDYYDEAVAARG